MVGHRARVGKILVAEDAKGPANLRDIRCSSQGVIQLPAQASAFHPIPTFRHIACGRRSVLGSRYPAVSNNSLIWLALLLTDFN